MMVYKVQYKNYNQFLKALENREWVLIERITSALLIAFKKQKEEIQVFEIETDDDQYIDFIIEEKHYIKKMKICLEEYVKRELYEKCAEIKKAIDSYEKIKTSST